LLTDSDQKNDPGHTPQADLLDAPAHLDQRNIVYFDNHVSTIPYSALTVDDPPYGL
jgi:prepilin-type processing-associated H-X9-DG protein